MVRISAGRMRGTGFGAVVLHASPEAALGRNFAVIQDGDIISLDVPGRSLILRVSSPGADRQRQDGGPPSKADRIVAVSGTFSMAHPLASVRHEGVQRLRNVITLAAAADVPAAGTLPTFLSQF